MKRTIRMFYQMVPILALLALMPACTNMGDEGAAAPVDGPYVVMNVDRYAFEGGETDHYVAAIDEEIFVGVAVAEQSEESRAATVYLCDNREVSQWISGEIRGEQGTLNVDGSRAELTISEDHVSGSVIVDGGEPRSFTAELADESAGVFETVVMQGGEDYRFGWIVLNDGRQRGPMDGKGNDPYPVDLN